MAFMDANAIIVQADQTPGQVSFHNFNELKDIMEQGLAFYKSKIYTEDNLSVAEEDYQTLKDIKKKLADKKKELESAYSMPIEEVKKQLDELIAMVKEPMEVLDKLLKENSQTVKQAAILKYAHEKCAVLGEYAEKVISSPAFFNKKWLNVSYKTKEWQEDIDNIILNASDAFKTIQNIGGEKKGAMLGLYFRQLSMDGMDDFMEMADSDVKADISVSLSDDDLVTGYKVLKITGTKRQMLQLITQLECSELEFEELEDGMPKDMTELTEPDFDSFVCFDIEHTGTYGIDNGDAEAEITEIGAVKVQNGEVVEKFSMLANPGRKILPSIVELTHITDEMLEKEPPISEVIKQFKEFVGDNVLVGHNIKICDLPHIARAGKRAGVHFDNAFLDTRKLAKKFQEKNHWENIKLPYLSKYYNIPQTEAHRAWCDAEANAYVYLKLREEK